MLKIVLLVGLLKLVCTYAETICIDDCVVIHEYSLDYNANGVCDHNDICDYGFDCDDCGTIGGVCYDDCTYYESGYGFYDYTNNGDCDEFLWCSGGYDCTDCGVYRGFCHNLCFLQRSAAINYTADGVCNDDVHCDYGHDCTDCGLRVIGGTTPTPDETQVFNGSITVNDLAFYGKRRGVLTWDESYNDPMSANYQELEAAVLATLDAIFGSEDYYDHSVVLGFREGPDGCVICDFQIVYSVPDGVEISESDVLAVLIIGFEDVPEAHAISVNTDSITLNGNCQAGYKLDDNGLCVVDHEVSCEVNSMTVIFNSMMTSPIDVYLGEPGCPAAPPTGTTDPVTGFTYYHFTTVDLSSCGITATTSAGYIIYSTDVIADGVAVVNVQCKMETTQTVTIQIMANPCITPVTIEGDLTAKLAVFWYDDDSYTSLQPDDQYVNACEDTKIYIGIALIGTPALDVVVFIKNCTITGTAPGATEVQTFTIVEEYGCPVDGYGFMIDGNSNNTNVLFCFNPYGIVNDNGITVFDLTCDVVLCLPGEPGCTQDCDAIPGRFKKSTHLTNGNTNPIIGGPFILNECT